MEALRCSVHTVHFGLKVPDTASHDRISAPDTPLVEGFFTRRGLATSSQRAARNLISDSAIQTVDQPPIRRYTLYSLRHRSMYVLHLQYCRGSASGSASHEDGNIRLHLRLCERLQTIFILKFRTELRLVNSW